MATQASKVPDARSQLGYGLKQRLSPAQAHQVLALALALAQKQNQEDRNATLIKAGAAAQAAAVARGIARDEAAANRLQATANLVALRGQNAANLVAVQITNFQKQLYAMVAANGHNVLTPAFQQKFNNVQDHFRKLIQSHGGDWVTIPLESIAPQLQNSNLAKAGVGLTNASTAAILQADTTALNNAILAAQARTAAAAAAALNPAINPATLPTVGSPNTTPITSGTTIPTPIGSGGVTAGGTVTGVLGGGGGSIGGGGDTAGPGTPSGSGSGSAQSFFAGLGFTSWTQVYIVLGLAGIGVFLLLRHKPHHSAKAG